jgi:uncharacterized circularly permuted ATP-grasp superfamily protein
MAHLAGYDPGRFHDELYAAPGQPRPGCELLARRLEGLPAAELLRRQRAAEQALLTAGITFNVYGHEAGTERIFPFDLIPRIVAAHEWALLDKGLQQRIRALNLFIDDVYHERRIVRDGVLPAFVLETSKGLRAQCQNLRPPLGVWCHITGTDLVRGADGQFYVLEDNLRCPSGVSYVLENRRVMKRTFPQVFDAMRVRPVDAYASRLREMLDALAPDVDHPTVVLLTPGMHNSAYYEHSFLAQQMGIELVEGRDLVVRNGDVTMRTTRGFQKVDVIYRRIDDDFLDPNAFRPDSMLGVPGLFEAWRRGKVALANAPGTGVADDKVVYAYVPDMIRYYLHEEPLVPNVPTFVCWDDAQRAQVLANLDQLVVKAANESGGYGMLIGPQASDAERKEFASKISENPRNYIAQPTIQLSTVPTLCPDAESGELRIEGRHVDLRPYVLYGKDIFVLPGGLTRVALRKGSLVVNSSQGGGSKDTWVLAEPAAEGR